MSRKLKRAIDRLLSFIALAGVTVVPAVYITGTIQMHKQLLDLKAQIDYLNEMVVDKVRQDALASVVEEMPVAVKDDPEAPQVEQVELIEPIIPVAPGEEELLVRLVIAESGNQPYEGQVAVAQVVCDRYLAGYGDSITDIIYAKNQFAKPYSKDISKYPLASEAVHAVLYEGERAFSDTTIFFCNPGKSSESALKWMRTKPYVGKIADHEFYGV